jgi:hypothetical protein
VGPRHRQGAGPGDQLAGPARRRDHARAGRPRGASRRAQRPAADPYFARACWSRPRCSAT